MDRSEKLAELERRRAELYELENEIGIEELGRNWPPKGYYFYYDVMAGCFLGLFGAMASLLYNFAGEQIFELPAALQGRSLAIIRVYLTFPLGDDALTTNYGLALVIGVCLYLATGMVLGIPFQLAQTLLLPRAVWFVRIVFALVLSVLLWLFNFYGILSWLQPLLFDGDWIVRLIPWWVAMTTHMVFGVTMALAYPLGVFEKNRLNEGKA